MHAIFQSIWSDRTSIGYSNALIPSTLYECFFSGLAGKTPLEEAVADMIVDQASDVAGLTNMIFAAGEDGKVGY